MTAPFQFRKETIKTSSERWCTPPEVFDPLNAEFNFDLDAAADEETARKDNWSGDSLGSEDWPGTRIWVNPPYGKKLEPFVRRMALEADKGKLIVALIPFRCRGAWWHESVLGRATEVRCVRKRVSFIRPEGTRGNFTGSFDSCVVIWRGHYRGPTILTAQLQSGGATT
jgi:site-specific DNA-methyltransferase (adenine-specific)